ncbi:LOW QUALITY PROTEIN: 1-aminocyclopropane-1-carboxylate synthase-like protein 1 [Argopecten irradians]|uniref:LOW QUALITY PROTEIN: 1-aminocyclopropane-1-carboxylate synthase-like protein 1 n=1 Tax=Argopecten irradians TaxID=31199 RepID=UPI003720AB31
MKKAKQEGLTVRGLLITSPNNPTGKVYTPKELTQMMEFCKRRKLHVVFDEIYALSSQGQKCFTSVLSLDIPDPGRTHFMWGISKDFGLSGFRCGVIYSHDLSVIAQLQKISIFSSIPAPTQFLVNDILSDTDWLDNMYFPTYYDRARKSFLLVKDVLDKFHITTAYDCKHVIFYWMDLSQFLKEKTKENEIELFDKFMEAGVYICPGTILLSNTPGWFRLTYTLSQVDLEEGLRRFRSVLMKTRKDLGVQ